MTKAGGPDIAGTFTITADTLTLAGAPVTGTVAATTTTPVPATFAFGWSDTTTVGPRAGAITLTNTSNPAKSALKVMKLKGAVVEDRQLTVMAIGKADGSPFRIMKDAPITTSNTTYVDGKEKALKLTIGTIKEDPAALDTAATRVDIAVGATTSDLLESLTVTNLLAKNLRFSKPGQVAKLSATFSELGNHMGSIDLKPMLTDGEAASLDGAAGATVQSAIMDYDVNVLERRAFAAVAEDNHTVVVNALRGALAVPGSFDALSTNDNADDEHATRAWISPGNTTIKSADEKNKFIIAKTQLKDPSGAKIGYVDSAAPKNLAYTAFLNKLVTQDGSYGTAIVASGGMKVLTAEAKSTLDTYLKSDGKLDGGKYPDLVPVDFSVNVGIAEVGATQATFGTALSAYVKAGALLGDSLKTKAATATKPAVNVNLASKVNPAGTLIENATLMSEIPSEGGYGTTSLDHDLIFGTIGTEAEILKSTKLTSASTVSMQWRSRSDAENATAFAAPPMPQGEARVSYLISDVVNISGVDGVTYALQMTADNRINKVLGGDTNTVYQDTWLSQLVGTGPTAEWTPANPAVGLRHTGVSLAEFLTINKKIDLATLVGHYGEDTPDLQGIYHPWAIVTGGGTFGVVPEPSTFALLGSMAIGLIAFALRRRQ